ncbi:MAG: threonine/serine dehydratase [Deltaproteobacteria bacterium]|nr:threonine/serine dehydratase [Deltaproteobacteria bacterium]
MTDTASPPDLPALDIEDVRAAAARIEGRVRTTPVLRIEALDQMAGAELWLKAENLQHIGAFKARGAMHAVGQLGEAGRARGVITFSSGNHAQAVALAARSYGCAATIVMPTDAPKIKVAGVKALGGEIVFAGTTSDVRREAAMSLAERSGAAVVQPFDHPHIVAGAGTATLELVDEVAARTGGGTLDALLVPVGGGGLIAGACLAAAPAGTAIYSVEPHGCDAMARSLEAGERVAVSPGPTLADGLKPTMVGALNFAIAKQHVAGSFRVGDDDLGPALRALLVHGKVLVEPSGAAALAVALTGRLPGAPRRIGVILSGGNVDPSLVARLIDTPAEA